MINYCEIIDKAKVDEKAFEKLLEIFYIVIKSNCKKVLRFCPYVEYEELMQLGRIGLMNAIERYDDSKGGNFRAFANTCIYRSMFKAVREYYRQKKYNNNYTIALEDSLPDYSDLCFNDVIADKDCNVDNYVVSKIIYEAFAEKLGKNSQEYQVMCLHSQGYSYAEIAKRLNISYKRVDYLMQKIKKMSKRHHK